MTVQTPLRKTSYRAAARKLRAIADKLEAQCEPQTSRDLASLTRTVHSMAEFARTFSQRHRNRAKPPAC